MNELTWILVGLGVFFTVACMGVQLAMILWLLSTLGRTHKDMASQYKLIQDMVQCTVDPASNRIREMYEGRVALVEAQAKDAVKRNKVQDFLERNVKKPGKKTKMVRTGPNTLTLGPADIAAGLGRSLPVMKADGHYQEDEEEKES